MIACPACQAGNPAGAQFCGSCGNQLAAGAPAAAGQAGFAYAGFWMRLLAAIIDSLILLIPNVIVLLAVDVFAAQLVLLIIRPAYTIGFWIGAEGATPGKMAMGIRIAMASGEPLGVGPAVLRYVGYFASAITLGIGYLMIAFTGEKRGLHDQIAGTVVIKTR